MTVTVSQQLSFLDRSLPLCPLDELAVQTTPVDDIGEVVRVNIVKLFSRR